MPEATSSTEGTDQPPVFDAVDDWMDDLRDRDHATVRLTVDVDEMLGGQDSFDGRLFGDGVTDAADEAAVPIDEGEIVRIRCDEYRDYMGDGHHEHLEILLEVLVPQDTPAPIEVRIDWNAPAGHPIDPEHYGYLTGAGIMETYGDPLGDDSA